MNLQIIDVYPIEEPYLSDKEKYTYKAVLINIGDDYFYWARGVTIKISKYENEMLFANSKVGLFSYGLKLHLKVDLHLLKSKEVKKDFDRWGIWFLTGFLNRFPPA
jgi:hypothetical protein